MLNVTGTDYCKCRSQCVLVKQFLFIYLLFIIYVLLRFAYSDVLLMTAFLKIYPIPKIRNIPIYRLAYSIAMYTVSHVYSIAIYTVSQYIVSQPLYRDAYRIARFLQYTALAVS